jgi:hypothetical protein
MSELDYETLFNDIMVQTREKRKNLKEVLDRVFEEDSGRTADVLADMLRVNEKAQAIESSRPGFMSVMAAMRSVRAVREELLEKVDRLMDEIRRFLALKEELANDRLEKLTTLFREELGNPQFKFHFHLMDDQELHHLSEVRSIARREIPGEAPAAPRHAPPAPPPAPPPPAPPVQATVAPETQASWAAVPAAAATAAEEPGWTSTQETRPSWLNQNVNAAEPATIRGPAPDPQYADDHDHAAAAAAPEPDPEATIGASSPYEVDVDVLRILSEETFRPPKR